MDFKDIIIKGNRRLSQQDCELLYKTAREIKPKTIVEIGSMDGCSTMVLGLVVKEFGGHLYCIEPNPKTAWKVNIKALYLEDYVTLIMQSSPWVDTKIIPKPIDYLFIDGDHKTRWCLVDYHFWEHYVKPGGRIAFHDYTDKGLTGSWIKRAVNIILEDDNLITIGKSNDRGMIVFEKPKNNWL